MIKINDKEIGFNVFPNGETQIIEKDIDNSLLNKFFHRVTFKYESDTDLIKLMMVKRFIDSKNLPNSKIRLDIYYMPYSRMDRSEDGSAFTLKYVSEFINNLGFNTVYIIEPHSDVTMALIDNSKPYYINEELLPFVMTEVNFNTDNGDMIFYPDLGASKRYIGKFKYPYLTGNKVRDFKTGEIKGLDVMGDVPENPNKIIIVDDLTSRGGTFVHSAKALRKLGFKEVYLLVAHSENTVFKGELFDNIDKLFTTDTILTEQNNWENKKFEKQLKIYKV